MRVRMVKMYPFVVLAIIAARITFAPDHGLWTLPFLSEENQRKYSLKLTTALAMLIALDVTGLALGWRFFAHGAHLGGAFS